MPATWFSTIHTRLNRQKCWQTLDGYLNVPSGNLTVCYWSHGPFIDYSPIEDGDFPVRSVKLPEGNFDTNIFAMSNQPNINPNMGGWSNMAIGGHSDFFFPRAEWTLQANFETNSLPLNDGIIKDLTASTIESGQSIATSLFSLTGNHGLCQGNHPQMAARFRLVKYYKLPSLYPIIDRIWLVVSQYIPIDHLNLTAPSIECVLVVFDMKHGGIWSVGRKICHFVRWSFTTWKHLKATDDDSNEADRCLH